MVRGRLGAAALGDLLGQWRTDRPAYEALADRIQLLLVDGRVSADVRLPSERELSERLELSRTTITAAYRLLRETGYARSVRGSGTTTTLPLLSPEGNSAGWGRVDLAMATLPATRLLAAAAEHATAQLIDHYATPGYHLFGLPELRRAVADRYTARGLPTEPTQILVTTGAQSAIALVARGLLARGDRAYAESPSYPHAFDALRLAGGRLVTSPVTTEHGWEIDALRATMSRTAPALAYVMPDFHNPTGRSMSVEDRQALLAAAARVDATVIADETTAELDIDRPDSHPPLAVLAGRHRTKVIHIGSASKQLWGGLRVGWIRASPEVLTGLAGLRPASDLGTPVWDQLVTARLVTRTDEVIEERRAQLLERRRALYAGVAERLPDWELPATLHGGLTAWAKLPVAASSQLAMTARAANLHITAGPRFGPDGAYERHIRLPLAPEPADLLRALDLLAELWQRVVAAPSGGATMTDRMV